LCKGYVNSFVDFFYLTHRTDQDTNRSEIPEAHLPQVQANLCSAERAHRRADSNRVLEAYEKLANYFQERGDYKTSVYFYEKCLDIAESTRNLGQQSIANNNLGVTHDALGDLPLATRFHERHLQIALQMLDDERIIYANKQLCDVYRRHAEQALEKNDVAAAVERFHKCLKCAIDSGDSRVEGTVTHQLGAACARAGDTTQALKWQLRYLELAKQTNDQLAEAEAYAAIAESYTALGDAEQAAKYLAWCNELSARNQQPKQQVEACTALGLNASKAGDYERAVAYFEKAYQIARGLNDQKLIDSARIHLGVARGNVGMGVYMDVVNKDLSTLLRWKTRRVNF
jgi:tetratricopeptide (TPR) repeat protein